MVLFVSSVALLSVLKCCLLSTRLWFVCRPHVDTLCWASGWCLYTCYLYTCFLGPTLDWLYVLFSKLWSSSSQVVSTRTYTAPVTLHPSCWPYSLCKYILVSLFLMPVPVSSVHFLVPGVVPYAIILLGTIYIFFILFFAHRPNWNWFSSPAAAAASLVPSQLGSLLPALPSFFVSSMLAVLPSSLLLQCSQSAPNPIGCCQIIPSLYFLYSSSSFVHPDTNSLSLLVFCFIHMQSPYTGIVIIQSSQIHLTIQFIHSVLKHLLNSGQITSVIYWPSPSYNFILL